MQVWWPLSFRWWPAQQKVKEKWLIRNSGHVERDCSIVLSGKKGSTAGSHAKMCTSGANSVGSEIRGKNSRRNPTCARRDAWELATEVCKLKMKSRETFCSPAEVWVISAFFSSNPEEREFVIYSGASMHMLSRKDPSSGELETLRRSRNRITVVTATGEVQTNEEAQVYVHDLHLYVTVQWLEDTPAVLSLGKPWEKHGYTHEWASGQMPHLTKDSKNILLQDWELRRFGGPWAIIEVQHELLLDIASAGLFIRSRNFAK